MTTSTPAATTVALSTATKVGLALASLLAVVDLLGPVTPQGETGDGPPQLVIWLGFALGVATVAGIVWALRTSARSALWLVAGTRLVSALLAVPAFFVDVPRPVQVLVGVGMALTAAAVALVLTPARREGGSA